MENNLFELLAVGQQKQELERVLTCNEKTSHFNLMLTREEAGALMQKRTEVLKAQKRVEFGESILPLLIETFCDSQYIWQTNYAETIAQLQEIFYLFKNESADKLSDIELLEFMKQQFEGVCYGSTEYLGETCLERFAKAIRSGYQEFGKSGQRDEYSQFSEEEHWNSDLYHAALSELIQ